MKIDLIIPNERGKQMFRLIVLAVIAVPITTMSTVIFDHSLIGKLGLLPFMSLLLLPMSVGLIINMPAAIMHRSKSKSPYHP